ncbi:MAG: VOC family protein [Pirellulales bacterium]
MLKHHVVVLCCAAVGLIAMETVAERRPARASNANDSANEKKPAFRPWGIRYQVKDVERSVAFYTAHLGFKLDQQAGAAFAKVTIGNMALLHPAPTTPRATAITANSIRRGQGALRMSSRCWDTANADRKPAVLHQADSIKHVR